MKRWLSCIWIGAKHGREMARTLRQIHDLPEYVAEPATDDRVNAAP